MDKIPGSPVSRTFADINASRKLSLQEEDTFDTLLSTATEKVTLNESSGHTSSREGINTAKPSPAASELSSPAAAPVEALAASAPEGTASLDAPYRFASKYTVEEIMTDPVKARAFEHDYLAGESAYYAIARDPESGLTYDGYSLDVKTGEPVKARDWSAPSKECLDIAVLTKAVMGDPKAALVVAKGDPKKAAHEAAAILEKKIGSYEKFHKQYPGFGGFLPWFKVGKEISPVDNWKTAAPGLDNGELVWALLAAEYALKKSGRTELAERYHRYTPHGIN